MDFKLVNFCEVDKYASQAYCAIHNVDPKLNLGDINNVNEKEIEDFNMIVGGSPCQDFSVAGKLKGAKWTCGDCYDEDGEPYSYNPLTVHYTKRNNCPKCNSLKITKTRSSLLVEWLRILREKRPNFGIYENVKNIVGKQFRETFELFESELQEYGYNTYWSILNSQDYGIPQHRERLYLILVKKELDNGKFEFPKPFDSQLRLKDFLETTPDLRFCISQERVDKLMESNFSQEKYRVQNSDICACLLSRDYKDPKCVLMDNGSVRKLTPKEYWRLMGFSDLDFERAKWHTESKVERLSNSQLYKMAGNSIVVKVLFHIFIELYNAMPLLFTEVRLGSFFSGCGAFEKALGDFFKHMQNRDWGD